MQAIETFEALNEQESSTTPTSQPFANPITGENVEQAI